MEPHRSPAQLRRELGQAILAYRRARHGSPYLPRYCHRIKRLAKEFRRARAAQGSA